MSLDFAGSAIVCCKPKAALEAVWRKVRRSIEHHRSAARRVGKIKGPDSSGPVCVNLKLSAKPLWEVRLLLTLFRGLLRSLLCSSFLRCVLHRLILPNIKFATSTRSQCDLYIRFFGTKVKKKMRARPMRSHAVPFAMRKTIFHTNCCRGVCAHARKNVSRGLRRRLPAILATK